MWFTSFFVDYYTVKLIGSVVYCLNIFKPKLSCENVLACHMPDKHMPGEFLPAFLLFPPSLRQSIFLLCQHKRIHVHSVWRLFFQSMHHKLHTNKNKKDFIKSYPFCDHKEKKKNCYQLFDLTSTFSYWIQSVMWHLLTTAPVEHPE